MAKVILSTCLYCFLISAVWVISVGALESCVRIKYGEPFMRYLSYDKRYIKCYRKMKIL